MKKIHIVYGPQGAGKSTYSKKLAMKVNGVHLSIDEWMWRLYGADLPKPLNIGWVVERVERCEQQIWSTAKDIIATGSEVVLDLGFTKISKRKQFLSLAKESEISAQLHYILAPHTLRKERVLNRNKAKGATFSFEVTPGMFDFMESEFQEATSVELEKALIVDTGSLD